MTGPAPTVDTEVANKPAPRRPLRSVARSAFWWNLSKYLVMAFCKVWFRHSVEGRDNVPDRGAVLLVAIRRIKIRYMSSPLYRG